MPGKPMLAGKCNDIRGLRYPVLCSQKLDGVRATVQDGILLARSLKPIPNVNVQKLFARLPEGLDGELIVGDPTHPEAYRRTVSVVMSENKPAHDIRFHVFDVMGEGEFQHRLGDVSLICSDTKKPLEFVQHVLINNAAELERLEEAWVKLGHEGVMIRSIKGPYKHGRSSENEGYLLKLKRWIDGEAKILAAHELMHNDNAATTNELGRTHRSTHKAGMRPGGVLGTLDVEDLKTGGKFNVGGGFTAKERKELWEDRENLIGRIITYKYFPTGSKDKPRFPGFKGFRDERDMSE